MAGISKRSRAIRKGWETRRRKKKALHHNLGLPRVIEGPASAPRTAQVLTDIDASIERMDVALTNIGGRIAHLTGAPHPCRDAVKSYGEDESFISKLNDRGNRICELAEVAERIHSLLSDFV